MSSQQITQLTKDFFFDENYIFQDMENLKRRQEEVKYHRYFLSDELTFEMKLHALLEGNSADFLFNIKPYSNLPDEIKVRGAKIKRFINDLENEQQQELIVSFYHQLYDIIHGYYRDINRETNYWNFCEMLYTYFYGGDEQAQQKERALRFIEREVDQLKHDLLRIESITDSSRRSGEETYSLSNTTAIQFNSHYRNYHSNPIAFNQQ